MNDNQELTKLNEFYRNLEEEDEAKHVTLPQRLAGWAAGVIVLLGLYFWIVDVFNVGVSR